MFHPILARRLSRFTVAAYGARRPNVSNRVNMGSRAAILRWHHTARRVESPLSLPLRSGVALEQGGGNPMAMEHRWGRRVAVDIGVTLHCRPSWRLRGRLRNLSSGGAFVRIPATLPPNTRVEMVFTAHHDGTAQIHRFATAVSRATPQGVGLIFLQYDPKTLSALLLRLEQQSSPRLLRAPHPAIHRDGGETRAPETGAGKTLSRSALGKNPD